MNILTLAFREIRLRRWGFLASIAAIALTAAFFSSLMTFGEASEAETTRLMKDMGFNVLILPEGDDLAGYWDQDFASGVMPEEYASRLAESRLLTIRHLTAYLEKKIAFRNRQVLLSGRSPEISMQEPGGAKALMSPSIPKGKLYAGARIAEALNLKEGDEISDLAPGKIFRVALVLPEKGDKDDVRIFGNLADIQEVLDMPGKINALKALSCACQGNRLAGIRKEIAAILPGVKVIEFESIAVAREETRKMMARYGAAALGFVMAVSALWIAFLAWQNVRERRAEIAVLRSLGVSGGRLFGLFFIKALLAGIFGALLGLGIGWLLTFYLSPLLFQWTGPKAGFSMTAAWAALIASPLLCLIASFVPAMRAASLDPARVLLETET